VIVDQGATSRKSWRPSRFNVCLELYGPSTYLLGDNIVKMLFAAVSEVLHKPFRASFHRPAVFGAYQSDKLRGVIRRTVHNSL